MVGLKYDFETKTYKEAPKISEKEKEYLETKYESKKSNKGYGR